ncbi:hypothetical protein EXU48_22130 [Occultella glacieicola]|uniref:HEAT repeat domain-containing protein n=1 Tax=Occultella glacieicola TaxID=2518684 RepID=A0ABY2DXM3_9MICO|nr:HEAT repeat domain-containing protein [Occultella glacieicola]TDE88791.1 hypothetical protein EXU48_22130 [Occultella glacieicola]
MADDGPDDPTAHRSVWVAQAERELGTDEVLGWCADLLAGADPLASPHPLAWIGGRPGAALPTDLTGPRGPMFGHWSRVWAARAMRYCWAEGTEAADGAAAALVGALTDAHWRVREMAAKVAGSREIGAAADRLAALLEDDVPRVRAAAAKALGAVGEREHLAPLADVALDDPDGSARSAAQQARRTIAARVDLPADEY